MVPLGEATLAGLLDEVLTTSSPFLTMMRLAVFLFMHGGWLPFFIVVGFGAWKVWLLNIRIRYGRTRKWVILAIDVPKDNEQSPKAVENIFAHLAGAHGTLTKAEMYWEGKTQDWFSLEIISIEGYVQFLIRTVTRFRDLVEAAVYSQYPDAVITEVEDYTKGYPNDYPNDRYDIYGTEYIETDNQALPFRTYPEFEHSLTGEFKDPMAAVLETMNKLGEGEQLWMQIILMPIEQKTWKKESAHLIKKLIGEKVHHREGIFAPIFREAGYLFGNIVSQITGSPPEEGGAHAAGAQAGPPNMMLYLPPHIKAQVEAIARKINKLGFGAKIRTVYIATKEHFNAYHGREALVGAIKQFNTNDLNSLKPDTHHLGVHAHYFFTEWRKNWKRRRIMKYYKGRATEGDPLYVLNSEELASLWHFPSKTITVPMRHMVQKTTFKRIAPPSSLPFGEVNAPAVKSAEKTPRAPLEAPENLPLA